MPQINSGIKHNKKRNAGLLFEWLTSYITEMVSINEDKDSADVAIEIALRYFDKTSELGKELSAIRTLTESLYKNDILKALSIKEFKNHIKTINLKQSYIEKSNLIKEINHTLTNDMYERDINDYRLFASIYGLIESMERGDNKLISHYEQLIFENLKNEININENKEIDTLSEDERKIASSEEFIKKLSEQIINETNSLSELQKEVIENWSLYEFGSITEDLYRMYLGKKCNKVLEVIDAAISKQNSSMALEKLNMLREVYSHESVMSLPSDAATEHILEGLNLEKALL
jgi:hypothetical protein